MHQYERCERLTAVEATADCHYDDLEGEEPGETSKNGAALVVDGMDTDDVND